MTERAAPLVPARAWMPRFASTSPAFAPLARAAAPLAGYHDFPEVEDYTRLFAGDLVTAGGAPLRFVVQSDRAGRRRGPGGLGDLYDGKIYERGEVPTRARSYHDLFNALAWATYPKAKRALNARQYHALAARLPPRFTRLPGARTREQDALAMLDEGGVLLLASEGAAGAVGRAHASGDTAGLAALVRDGALDVSIFGHALFEHLVSSTAPVRGRGVVLIADGDVPDGIEARVALADARLSAKLAEPGGFPEATDAPAVPIELATLAAG